MREIRYKLFSGLAGVNIRHTGKWKLLHPEHQPAEEQKHQKTGKYLKWKHQTIYYTASRAQADSLTTPHSTSPKHNLWCVTHVSAPAPCPLCPRAWWRPSLGRRAASWSPPCWSSRPSWGQWRGRARTWSWSPGTGGRGTDCDPGRTAGAPASSRAAGRRRGRIWGWAPHPAARTSAWGNVTVTITVIWWWSPHLNAPEADRAGRRDSKLVGRKGEWRPGNPGKPGTPSGRTRPRPAGRNGDMGGRSLRSLAWRQGVWNRNTGIITNSPSARKAWSCSWWPPAAGWQRPQSPAPRLCWARGRPRGTWRGWGSCHHVSGHWGCRQQSSVAAAGSGSQLCVLGVAGLESPQVLEYLWAG